MTTITRELSTENDGSKERGPVFRALAAAGLVITVLLTTGQSPPLRPSSELSLLQGYWEGTGPGGECSVTISGHSLIYRQRDDFWFDTTFTLPEGSEPRQLHATILRSPEESTIGNVVVTLFELGDGTLNLGVIADFEEPPTEPVLASWDDATDRYSLRKAQPPFHLATPQDAAP